MTDIKPIIFTRGRLNNQVTLSQMPDYMKAKTTMVVYSAEYQAHKEMYGSICNVVSAPDGVQGIAKRREWAATNSASVYTNTWFDFRTIDANDFDWIGKEWEDEEFLPEDFHIQCQMVEKGIPILNLNKYATGGNKTQASGGCATTRTINNHNNGMIRFSKVWDKCTTLRWKDGWEKGSKKAALTIRLSKLWPRSKEELRRMEDYMRVSLGGQTKDEAKVLQHEANELRKELQANGI